MSSTDGPRDPGDARARFAELHDAGTFVMPNAWDVGSARLFASVGFEAIATTSSGMAAGMGRLDQTVTREELIAHVASICSAVDIPVNVDAEDGFGDSPEDLEETVALLAQVGASGLSIEDYRPAHGVIGLSEATDRVGTFVAAAHQFGMTVTARAENHLYGIHDIDDTLNRLRSYSKAGAHVLYAPGLIALTQFETVVGAVDRPVNGLLVPVGPTVGELREAGVRRLSTGGALAFAAYGAAVRGARELLGPGTQDYTSGVLSASERERAFGD